MVKLADLGFQNGVIFETILSTYNQNGNPNAAPMGVTMQNEQQIFINIYNSSSTIKNLQANKSAVINLTNNIDYYYKSAFKEVNPNEKLPREWFEKAEAVNAPKLKSADATIEVEVIEMVPIDSLKTKTLCSVKRISASKVYPQANSRAMAATLEAVIHATRIRILAGDPKEQKHVSRLLELIKNCNDVVKHSAPNSIYSEIMSDLMKKVDLWRKST